MKKLFLGILVFAMIFIIACSPTQNAKNNTETTNTAQNTAKAFPIERVVFTGINDSLYKLTDLKGHVVILDFWASWCGPCKRSIPFYNKMYKKYKDQGLMIFGLDVNEPKATILQAKEQLNISYNLGISNNDLNRLFQIQGIPAMFIFDKEGKLVEHFVGYAPELDTVIERLIKENL